MSYALADTRSNVGFRPGVVGMSYYGGGRLNGMGCCPKPTLGRVAGHAYLGQIPNTTITVGPDGQWGFSQSSQPTSQSIWDEIVQWASEETVIAGMPNALVALGAIFGAALWVKAKKR